MEIPNELNGKPKLIYKHFLSTIFFGGAYIIKEDGKVKDVINPREYHRRQRRF